MARKQGRAHLFVGSLLAVSLSGGLALADATGASQQVQQDVTLLYSARDLCLDPDPHIGPAERVVLTDNLALFTTERPNLNMWAADLVIALLRENGIPVPDIVVDIIHGIGDIGWVRITPTITVGPAGDVGVYTQVTSVHGADVDLAYPVSLAMSLPAANSFRCGDRIRIDTQPMVVTDPALLVTPPVYNLQFGPVLDNVRLVLHIGIRVEACIGLYIPGLGCLGYPIDWSSPTIDETYPIALPPGFENLPPLLGVCEDAFAPGAGTAELLSCNVSGRPSIFEEALDRLDEINRHGYNLSFGSFEPGSVQLATPDLPSIPGLPPLPDLNARFEKVPASALSYQSLDGGRRLLASGTKTGVASVSVDLVSLTDIVAYLVSAGLVATSYSLGGGLGSIDFGTVAPTISLDQDLSFELRPAVSTTLDLGVAMEYEIHDPALGHVGSGSGRMVPIAPGQSIVLTFPAERNLPASLTGLYTLGGEITTSTVQKYYRSVLLEALCLRIGSVFDECLLRDSVQKELLVTRPIEQHTIPLPAAVAQVAPPFSLDPETPALDIRSLAVAHVANLGDGERAVVYRLEVANGGDVPLADVDLERDFRATFGPLSNFQVTCVHSSGLAVNESFDGDEDTRLLEAGSALAPGQEGSIDMVVRLRPEASQVRSDGCFEPVERSAWSSGTAESPLGIEVLDRYDACTGTFTSPAIEAKVDLGAATIAKLEDYTLYGWSGVEMAGSFGLSKGNVGSGLDLKVVRTKVLPGSDPRILGDLHVGRDLLVSGSALTVDNLQVGGRQRLAGKNPSLQVVAAESLASDCVALMPPVELALPPVECGPGAACKRDLLLKAGQSAAAEPGGYRLIEMKAGSQLTFSSGTYDVGRLRIAGSGGTVTFDLADGPITLNLHAWTIAGENLAFLARNGSTRDIHVVYGGTEKLVLRDSLIQGSWLAPYATVTLNPGARLEGALHAAKVKVGPGANFAGHDAVGAPDVHPACGAYLVEGQP